MFDLQIDEKKKEKKLSSMNESCEKKPTAHQNILHVDVLYNIKRKKYKTVCAELAYIDKTSSTEKHFLGPNRKVVADRSGTNVRK
jgi:hypothetical protein